jgi:hypothetical protein
MSTKVYYQNTEVILSCGFKESNEDCGMFNQTSFIRDTDKLTLDEYGILHYSKNGVAYKGFNMFTDMLSVDDFT